LTILVLSYWLISGRHWFKGPIINLDQHWSCVHNILVNWAHFIYQIFFKTIYMSSILSIVYTLFEIYVTMFHLTQVRHLT
jgi:hypothetical protein